MFMSSNVVKEITRLRDLADAETRVARRAMKVRGHACHYLHATACDVGGDASGD